MTEILDLRLLAGLDPKGHFTQQKQVTVLAQGQPFVLNAIIAIGISMLLGGQRGLFLGLHEGLAAGVFFVATSLGVIYLFEHRPLKHYLINAGYQLVNFAVIGMIIGLWPTVKSVTP